MSPTPDTRGPHDRLRRFLPARFRRRHGAVTRAGRARNSSQSLLEQQAPRLSARLTDTQTQQSLLVAVDTDGPAVDALDDDLHPSSPHIVAILRSPRIPLAERRAAAAAVGYSEGVVRRRWVDRSTKVLRVEEVEVVSVEDFDSPMYQARLHEEEAAAAAAAAAHAEVAAAAAVAAAHSAEQQAAAAHAEAGGAPSCPSGLLGKWEQETTEKEKLEAILKAQGYGWATRKVVLAVRLNMQFAIDEDGDVLYTSSVPGQGEQRLKLVDGATLEVRALGTRMVIVARWRRDGAIEMEQTTYGGKGEVASTSTITNRYDERGPHRVGERVGRGRVLAHVQAQGLSGGDSESRVRERGRRARARCVGARVCPRSSSITPPTCYGSAAACCMARVGMWHVACGF